MLQAGTHLRGQGCVAGAGGGQAAGDGGSGSRGQVQPRKRGLHRHTHLCQAVQAEVRWWGGRLRCGGCLRVVQAGQARPLWVCAWAGCQREQGPGVCVCACVIVCVHANAYVCVSV